MCTRVFLVLSPIVASRDRTNLGPGRGEIWDFFPLNAQRVGCPLHSGRVPSIPVGIITLMLIYYVCCSSTQTARGKVTAVPVPKLIFRGAKAISSRNVVK